MAFLGLEGRNERLAKGILQMLLILSFMLFVSLFIGFGKQGFNVSSVLQQFFFYNPLAIVSAVIILLALVFERLVNKDDHKYGEGIGFYPDGDAPFPKTKIFNNPFRLILGCLIIFSILGLMAGITQQTYFGIGNLQQAFTKFDNAIYNLSQVVPSENLGVAALLAVVLVVLRIYARKNNLTPQNFTGLAWILGLSAFVAYGYVNHLLRYSTQDVAIMSVIFIWLLGGIITMASGSFLPFAILHAVNNTFYSISTDFSRDVSVLNIQIFVAALIAVYVYKYVVKSKGKRAGGGE